jgi:hypothetical protein
MGLRRWKQTVVLVAGMLSFLSFMGVGPAEAFKVDVNDDLKIASDFTLTYGGAWRTLSPSPALLANINADDGDRGFRKWDMINNRFTVSLDFDANFKKNYGVFIRPRAYYDFVYNGNNHNDSPRTANNGPVNGGPLGSNTDFMGETIELHGRKAEILDAFAYSKFDLAGHETVVRVGRQVVSWGESLFLQNGISSAQSPVDITQTNVPGTEIKDVLLPVGQIYSSFKVGGGVTLAGYYQWEWEPSRFDEAGSFYSAPPLGDFGLDAGRRILLPGLPPTLPYPAIERGGNVNPKDSGQFGVALRYVADWLNNTEFGLYYINYHDKLPQALWTPTGGTPTPGVPIFPGGMGALLNAYDRATYYFKYQENIHLLGASFSTGLGSANVAGEVSFRQGVPLQITQPITQSPFQFKYVEGDVLQAQLSTIYVAGASPVWNNLTITAEVGCNQAQGIPSDQLWWDKFAWGFTTKAAFDYFQIMKGLDLQVPLTYKANFHNSPVVGTFLNRADSANASADFTYQSVYKFSVGYTAYIGGSGDNVKSDRDYLYTSLKYTF